MIPAPAELIDLLLKEEGMRSAIVDALIESYRQLLDWDYCPPDEEVIAHAMAGFNNEFKDKLEDLVLGGFEEEDGALMLGLAEWCVSNVLLLDWEALSGTLLLVAQEILDDEAYRRKVGCHHRSGCDC